VVSGDALGPGSSGAAEAVLQQTAQAAPTAAAATKSRRVKSMERSPRVKVLPARLALAA
jgi:hypothetical protein